MAWLTDWWNRLHCKYRGHMWRVVWQGGRNSKGAPCLVCIRCEENGWKISD